MAGKFRVLIVDDESLAREGLRRQLSNYPVMDIIGEADSVASAVKLIENLHPDVVFLDIQMPNELGFTLFNKVSVDFEVVFVTAFDNFAIRAFEVNALDYLLKPISPSRLAQTVNRLMEQRSPSPYQGQLNYDDFILIDAKGRNGFTKLDSIVYLVAAGDYSEVFLKNGEKRLVLRTLREWEEKLPDKHFLRIHRGAIININYVEKTDPGVKSTFLIYMRNVPTPFNTSRKYATEIRKRFV